MRVISMFEEMKENKGIFKIKRETKENSVVARYNDLMNFFEHKLHGSLYFVSAFSYIRHPERETLKETENELNRIIEHIDDDFYYINGFDLLYVSKEDDRGVFCFEGFIELYNKMHEIKMYEIDYELSFDRPRVNDRLIPLIRDRKKNKRVSVLEQDLSAIIYQDDILFNWSVNISKNISQMNAHIGFEIKQRAIITFDEYADKINKEINNRKS